MNSTQPAAALMPCPFCGGEARLLTFKSMLGTVHEVSCVNCGDEVRKQSHELEETIAQWNRRASQPPPVGVPSEVLEYMRWLCEAELDAMRDEERVMGHYSVKSDSIAKCQAALTWLDAHRTQP